MTWDGLQGPSGQPCWVNKLDGLTDPAFLEFLERAAERRRNAFIEAIHLMMEGVTLVGVMGKQIPTVILRSMGLIPVYIASTDGYAMDPKGADPDPDHGCHLLQATTGYSTTDKCPLIYSVKALLTDDLCPQRLNSMDRIAKGKPFHVLDSNEADYTGLIRFLEEVSGKPFSTAEFAAALAEHNYTAALCDKLFRLFSEKQICFQDCLTILFGLQFTLELSEKQTYLKEALTLLENLPQGKPARDPGDGLSTVYFHGFRNLNVLPEMGSIKSVLDEIKGDSIPFQYMACDGEDFMEFDSMAAMAKKLQAHRRPENTAVTYRFNGCDVYSGPGVKNIQYVAL